MIMEAFMLDVASLDRSLYAAVAAQSLPIPAGPVYSILVSVIYPIFVVLEYQHHAASSVGR